MDTKDSWKPAKFHVNKIDAVKRQLETAIQLFFYEADPVSIHTLAAASYNLLRDLIKRHGGSPMFVKEQLIETVKPQYKTMIRNRLNEAENFFKHADRDADSHAELNVALTELLLYEGCLKYREITSEMPPVFFAFISWYMLSRAFLFNLPPDIEEMRKRFEINYAKQSRRAFFSDMMSAASVIGPLGTLSRTRRT